MGDMMDHPDLYELEVADTMRQLDDPSRSIYVDKQGRPIGMLTASKLSFDDGYKVVGSDVLVSPTFRVWVSTVWTAINYDFGRTGKPLMFETMVFPDSTRPWYDQYQLRWESEERAKAGHAVMVEAVRLDWSEKRFMRALVKMLSP